MKFKQIWELLDGFSPLWINDNGYCYYFENGDDIYAEYFERIVEYITTDGRGVLTIELQSEV
jgi:hypothetical protein